MREHGLCGRKKHRRNPRTTDSAHAQPVAANLIAGRPAPTKPNQRDIPRFHEYHSSRRREWKPITSCALTYASPLFA